MPATSRPRPLALTVLAGPSPGECLSKPGADVLRIGRIKTGNTFAVKSASVSSKHAELVWDDSEAAGDGTWFLVDVGSSNGTQINGNSKCLVGARAALALHRVPVRISTHALTQAMASPCVQR